MVETSQWHITSFYRFVRIEESGLGALKSELKGWMLARGMKGLVIVAPEGINGTVSGSLETIGDFKSYIRSLIEVADLRFKDSESTVRPFRRLSVDCRDEIVGMKRTDLVPESEEDHHLTASEWHAMITSENPPVVIDTRNKYETLAGKFRGAVDPALKTFSDLPEYLDSSNLPKDEPVLIYCTGGIRCEKAILAMRDRGFDKVYQLRDGILGYLAEFPNGEYEGDCFVFDDRVALDQALQPSGRYGICPGCGLTSNDKRQCDICARDYFVCTECNPTWPPVCGKTCRDRWRQANKLEARSR